MGGGGVVRYHEALLEVFLLRTTGQRRKKCDAGSKCRCRALIVPPPTPSLKTMHEPSILKTLFNIHRDVVALLQG